MKYRPLLMAAALTVAAPCYALDSPEDSWLHYRLGGGVQPIPPGPDITRLRLGADAFYEGGLSCGKFDPSLAYRNFFNALARNKDKIQAQLTNAASGAMAALPSILLARAYPQLYDAMQSGMARASEEIRLATGTCESMTAQAERGKAVEFGTLSVGSDWSYTAKLPGRDILTEHERIEDRAGDNGVAWVGGKDRGGKGQPPIEVVTGTTAAGYNLTLERPATSTSKPPSNRGRVAQLWRTPDEAGAWVQTVVGEVRVRTYAGGALESTPGKGLAWAVDQETDEVRDLLTDLVRRVEDPTPANLEAVSAPKVAVTREVIERIRQQQPGTRAVSIGKLAEEVGLARTIEKALLAKRMLRAGKREPNIANAEPAHDLIAEAVDDLQAEIDDLLLDARLRRELVSRSALDILEVSR